MLNRNFRISEGFSLSPDTLAILPMPYGSKYYSKILKVEGEMIYPQRPLEVIKKSCISYGTTYIGRLEGAKALTGITHKIPIVIDPIQKMYFFPTTSPMSNDCIWISNHHIETIKEVEKGVTKVVFKNGSSIEVHISLYSMRNQMYRTFVLSSKVEANMAQMDRRGMYYFKDQYFGAAEDPTRYKPNINFDQDDFDQTDFMNH